MIRASALVCVLIAALGLPLAAAGQNITYSAVLDGPSEAPPNSSPGVGFAIVNYDLAAHFMSVDVVFSGLVGATTNAHIHAATPSPFTGTAGVATQVPTFSGFPSGVTSGSYQNTFDTSLASTWNPTYITNNGGTVAGAEAAFASALAQGRAYFNIHSSAFAGGEIRGFLTAVPEPSSMLLLGAGVVGMAGIVRRRRAKRKAATK